MRLFLAFSALLFTASISSAGQVSVEGVHLCCGACVKAANGAFEGVEGVSSVSVEKDAGKIAFEATDAKAARKGLGALAKAGFAGKATFDGKEMKLPKGYKEEGKGDSVTIRGLHNCCGGCAEAITAALKGVEGVSVVECNKKNCSISGKDVSFSKLIAALHEVGMHGNIAAPQKDK